MENINIKIVQTETDFEKCCGIRELVFINGQNVPKEIEIDGLDDISEHYLVEYKDKAVGTARVRYLDHVAKIERVAILADYQGRKFGYALMSFILQNLRYNPLIEEIILSAQVKSIPFYQKLNFIIIGPEFLEANILHQDMKLTNGNSN